MTNTRVHVTKKDFKSNDAGFEDGDFFIVLECLVYARNKR